MVFSSLNRDLQDLGFIDKKCSFSLNRGLTRMTRITEWKDGSRWGWKALLQEESPEASPRINRWQNTTLAPYCLTYLYRYFAKFSRFLKILLLVLGYLSFFLAFSKFFLGVFSVGASCCIFGVKPDCLIIIRDGSFKVSQSNFGVSSVVVGYRIVGV